MSTRNCKQRFTFYFVTQPIFYLLAQYFPHTQKHVNVVFWKLFFVGAVISFLSSPLYSCLFQDVVNAISEIKTICTVVSMAETSQICSSAEVQCKQTYEYAGFLWIIEALQIERRNIYVCATTLDCICERVLTLILCFMTSPN